MSKQLLSYYDKCYSKAAKYYLFLEDLKNNKYYENTDGLSVKEKIDIWELLGCNLIEDENNVINAQKYWLMASNERRRKKMDDEPSSREIASYGNLYDDMVQFEDDNVFIKALIIRERILGIILTINVIF